jgi:uncharacterized membrane protein YdcZ (DUF606 family)
MPSLLLVLLAALIDHFGLFGAAQRSCSTFPKPRSWP